MQGKKQNSKKISENQKKSSSKDNLDNTGNRQLRSNTQLQSTADNKADGATIPKAPANAVKATKSLEQKMNLNEFQKWILETIKEFLAQSRTGENERRERGNAAFQSPGARRLNLRAELVTASLARIRECSQTEMAVNEIYARIIQNLFPYKPSTLLAIIESEETGYFRDQYLGQDRATWHQRRQDKRYDELQNTEWTFVKKERGKYNTNDLVLCGICLKPHELKHILDHIHSVHLMTNMDNTSKDKLSINKKIKHSYCNNQRYGIFPLYCTGSDDRFGSPWPEMFSCIDADQLRKIDDLEVGDSITLKPQWGYQLAEVAIRAMLKNFRQLARSAGGESIALIKSKLAMMQMTESLIVSLTVSGTFQTVGKAVFKSEFVIEMIETLIRLQTRLISPLLSEDIVQETQYSNTEINYQINVVTGFPISQCPMPKTNAASEGIAITRGINYVDNNKADQQMDAPVQNKQPTDGSIVQEEEKKASGGISDGSKREPGDSSDSDYVPEERINNDAGMIRCREGHLLVLSGLESKPTTCANCKENMPFNVQVQRAATDVFIIEQLEQPLYDNSRNMIGDSGDTFVMNSLDQPWMTCEQCDYNLCKDCFKYELVFPGKLTQDLDENSPEQFSWANFACATADERRIVRGIQKRIGEVKERNLVKMLANDRNFTTRYEGEVETVNSVNPQIHNELEDFIHNIRTLLCHLLHRKLDVRRDIICKTQKEWDAQRTVDDEVVGQLGEIPKANAKQVKAKDVDYKQSGLGPLRKGRTRSQDPATILRMKGKLDKLQKLAKLIMSKQASQATNMLVDNQLQHDAAPARQKTAQTTVWGDALDDMYSLVCQDADITVNSLQVQYPSSQFTGQGEHSAVAGFPSQSTIQNKQTNVAKNDVKKVSSRDSYHNLIDYAMMELLEKQNKKDKQEREKKVQGNTNGVTGASFDPNSVKIEVGQLLQDNSQFSNTFLQQDNNVGSIFGNVKNDQQVDVTDSESNVGQESRKTTKQKSSTGGKVDAPPKLADVLLDAAFYQSQSTVKQGFASQGLPGQPRGVPSVTPGSQQTEKSSDTTSTIGPQLPYLKKLQHICEHMCSHRITDSQAAELASQLNPSQKKKFAFLTSLKNIQKFVTDLEEQAKPEHQVVETQIDENQIVSTSTTRGCQNPKCTSEGPLMEKEADSFIERFPQHHGGEYVKGPSSILCDVCKWFLVLYQADDPNTFYKCPQCAFSVCRRCHASGSKVGEAADVVDASKLIELICAYSDEAFAAEVASRRWQHSPSHEMVFRADASDKVKQSYESTDGGFMGCRITCDRCSKVIKEEGKTVTKPGYYECVTEKCIFELCCGCHDHASDTSMEDGEVPKTPDDANDKTFQQWKKHIAKFEGADPDAASQQEPAQIVTPEKDPSFSRLRDFETQYRQRGSKGRKTIKKPDYTGEYVPLLERAKLKASEGIASKGQSKALQGTSVAIQPDSNGGNCVDEGASQPHNTTVDTPMKAQEGSQCDDQIMEQLDTDRKKHQGQTPQVKKSHGNSMHIQWNLEEFLRDLQVQMGVVDDATINAYVHAKKLDIAIWVNRLNHRVTKTQVQDYLSQQMPLNEVEDHNTQSQYSSQELSPRKPKSKKKPQNAPITKITTTTRPEIRAGDYINKVNRRTILGQPSMLMQLVAINTAPGKAKKHEVKFEEAVILGPDASKPNTRSRSKAKYSKSTPDQIAEQQQVVQTSMGETVAELQKIQDQHEKQTSGDEAAKVTKDAVNSDAVMEEEDDCLCVLEPLCVLESTTDEVAKTTVNAQAPTGQSQIHDQGAPPQQSPDTGHEGGSKEDSNAKMNDTADEEKEDADQSSSSKEEDKDEVAEDEAQGGAQSKGRKLHKSSERSGNQQAPKQRHQSQSRFGDTNRQSFEAQIQYEGLDQSTRLNASYCDSEKIRRRLRTDETPEQVAESQRNYAKSIAGAQGIQPTGNSNDDNVASSSSGQSKKARDKKRKRMVKKSYESYKNSKRERKQSAKKLEQELKRSGDGSSPQPNLEAPDSNIEDRAQIDDNDNDHQNENVVQQSSLIQEDEPHQIPQNYRIQRNPLCRYNHDVDEQYPDLCLWISRSHNLMNCQMEVVIKVAEALERRDNTVLDRFSWEVQYWLMEEVEHQRAALIETVRRLLPGCGFRKIRGDPFPNVEESEDPSVEESEDGAFFNDEHRTPETNNMHLVPTADNEVKEEVEASEDDSAIQMGHDQDVDENHTSFTTSKQPSVHDSLIKSQSSSSNYGDDILPESKNSRSSGDDEDQGGGGHADTNMDVQNNQVLEATEKLNMALVQHSQEQSLNHESIDISKFNEQFGLVDGQESWRDVHNSGPGYKTPIKVNMSCIKKTAQVPPEEHTSLISSQEQIREEPEFGESALVTSERQGGPERQQQLNLFNYDANCLQASHDPLAIINCGRKFEQMVLSDVVEQSSSSVLTPQVMGASDSNSSNEIANEYDVAIQKVEVQLTEEERTVLFAIGADANFTDAEVWDKVVDLDPCSSGLRWDVLTSLICNIVIPTPAPLFDNNGTIGFRQYRLWNEQFSAFSEKIRWVKFLYTKHRRSQIQHRQVGMDVGEFIPLTDELIECGHTDDKNYLCQRYYQDHCTRVGVVEAIIISEGMAAAEKRKLVEVLAEIQYSSVRWRQQKLVVELMGGYGRNVATMKEHTNKNARFVVLDSSESCFDYFVHDMGLNEDDFVLGTVQNFNQEYPFDQAANIYLIWCGLCFLSTIEVKATIKTMFDHLNDDGFVLVVEPVGHNAAYRPHDNCSIRLSAYYETAFEEAGFKTHSHAFFAEVEEEEFILEAQCYWVLVKEGWNVNQTKAGLLKKH